MERMQDDDNPFDTFSVATRPRSPEDDPFE